MEILKSVLFIEFLVDWPLGTFMALLIYAGILGGISFLIYWIYTELNEYNRPAIRGPAVIISKTFIAAHPQLVPDFNSSDGTVEMIRVNIPDHWYITIMVKGSVPLQGSISVAQHLYESVEEGQVVEALYYITRFSHELKPQELYQTAA